MVKIKGKRTDVDVDTEGLVKDNRKSAGAASRMMMKFSKVGLIGAILITVISGIMMFLGFFPCIITFFIGLVLIAAAIVSYSSFDIISKEL